MASTPIASIAGGFSGIFDVLREVDVRPVRAAAEASFTLAFISRDDLMAQHLAMLMYRGQRSHDLPRIGTSIALPFADRMAAGYVDIAVIVTRESDHNSDEIDLVQRLIKAKVPTLVCYIEEVSNPTQGTRVRSQWLPAEVILLPLGNDNTLNEAEAIECLVNAIRKMKAVDDLSLGRHLPAFRETVARSLIDDTAFANAAYTTGTGVLELNPIATVPLNVADFVILTKNQAIMAYKIALAMGLEADFKTVMPQLAAVVGSGFIFRQAARQLIGLIPGFGILPKIAVAWAGTYATGEIVYRFCTTGEKINGGAIKQIYEGALKRGKQIAETLFKRKKHAPTGREEKKLEIKD